MKNLRHCSDFASDMSVNNVRVARINIVRDAHRADFGRNRPKRTE